jgi:phage/plasmid-like protein (TIGR03299 family)
MTTHSYEWLANKVLAGFQAPGFNRPVWWHRLAEAQGHTPRTWPGAVPFEVVHEHLAGWEPTISELFDADMNKVTSHKLVRTPDGSAVIGIDHVLHLYGTWLTGTVKECLGDEAQISSAGLLNNDMQAWVTIERPEVATGPAGIKFSPFITFSTSLDGSLSTQINQNTQLPICDNTMNMARGQGVAFKHTSNSASRLGTYREVTMALLQGETDFRAILESLVTEEVSNKQFSKFLDKLVPVSDEDKPAKRTRSERKRQEITQLYRKDSRVTEWTGTAFGVVQAVNTWNQHMSQLRNTSGIEMTDTDLRAMRNYSDRLRGPKAGVLTEDEKTVKLLEDILDTGHKTQFATV